MGSAEGLIRTHVHAGLQIRLAYVLSNPLECCLPAPTRSENTGMHLGVDGVTSGKAG